MLLDARLASSYSAESRLSACSNLIWPFEVHLTSLYFLRSSAADSNCMLTPDQYRKAYARVVKWLRYIRARLYQLVCWVLEVSDAVYIVQQRLISVVWFAWPHLHDWSLPLSCVLFVLLSFLS